VRPVPMVMRAIVACALTIAACEKREPPPPAACGAYVDKELANAFAGALQGSAQVKYVKAEWSAKYRAAALEDCKALKSSYVECAVRSAVDACADALTEAERRDLVTQLAADGLAASLYATTAPASIDECREVATRMAMVLEHAATDATRAKIPSADAIAELCQRAKWSAFYVRCTNAGDKSCKAEEDIMAGVKALILGP
jgi:hypothetical protein